MESASFVQGRPATKAAVLHREIFDGYREVASLTHEVARIARACSLLGMPVGGRLGDCADRIETACEQMRDAFAAYVHGQADGTLYDAPEGRS